MICKGLAHNLIKELSCNDKDKHMLIELMKNYTFGLRGFLNEEYLIKFHYLITELYGHLPEHCDYLTLCKNARTEILNNREFFINTKENDGNDPLIYPEKREFSVVKNVT